MVTCLSASISLLVAGFASIMGSCRKDLITQTCFYRKSGNILARRCNRSFLCENGCTRTVRHIVIQTSVCNDVYLTLVGGYYGSYERIIDCNEHKRKCRSSGSQVYGAKTPSHSLSA